MADVHGLDAPRWLRALLVLAAVAAMGLLVLMPLAVVLGSGFAKGLHAWAAAIVEPDALAALRLTLFTASSSANDSSSIAAAIAVAPA